MHSNISLGSDKKSVTNQMADNGKQVSRDSPTNRFCVLRHYECKEVLSAFTS